MASGAQPVAMSPRKERDREAQLAALRTAIADGIADLDAGRSSDIETVAKELRDRYAAWPTKKTA
jgi:predicted transcriptional regulator